MAFSYTRGRGNNFLFVLLSFGTYIFIALDSLFFLHFHLLFFSYENDEHKKVLQAEREGIPNSHPSISVFQCSSKQNQTRSKTLSNIVGLV